MIRGNMRTIVYLAAACIVMLTMHLHGAHDTVKESLALQKNLLLHFKKKQHSATNDCVTPLLESLSLFSQKDVLASCIARAITEEQDTQPTILAYVASRYTTRDSIAILANGLCYAVLLARPTSNDIQRYLNNLGLDKDKVLKEPIESEGYPQPILTILLKHHASDSLRNRQQLASKIKILMQHGLHPSQDEYNMMQKLRLDKKCLEAAKKILDEDVSDKASRANIQTAFEITMTAKTTPTEMPTIVRVAEPTVEGFHRAFTESNAQAVLNDAQNTPTTKNAMLVAKVSTEFLNAFRARDVERLNHLEKSFANIRTPCLASCFAQALKADDENRVLQRIILFRSELTNEILFTPLMHAIETLDLVTANKITTCAYDQARAIMHRLNTHDQSLLDVALSNADDPQKKDALIATIAFLLDRGFTKISDENFKQIQAFTKGDPSQTLAKRCASIVLQQQHAVEYREIPAPNTPESPLLLAAQHGDKKSVSAFLASADSNRTLLRQSINAVDQDGNTPLIWAVKHGWTDIAAAILKIDNSSINHTNEDRQTALGWAMHHCNNNQTSALKLLLQHGANPNIPDNNDQTPLMIAAFISNLEAVQLLVDHGACVAQRGPNGHSAFTVACSLSPKKKQNRALIEFLFNQTPTITQDDLVVALGHRHDAEFIEKICERPLDTTAPLQSTETPLTVAIKKGYPLETIKKVVERCASKGVNLVNTKNKGEAHPVTIAASTNYPEEYRNGLIAFLKEHGATLEAVPDAPTPSTLATSSSDQQQRNDRVRTFLDHQSARLNVESNAHAAHNIANAQPNASSDPDFEKAIQKCYKAMPNAQTRDYRILHMINKAQKEFSQKDILSACLHKALAEDHQTIVERIFKIADQMKQGDGLALLQKSILVCTLGAKAPMLQKLLDLAGQQKGILLQTLSQGNALLHLALEAFGLNKDPRTIGSTIALLLEHGANPAIQNTAGKTAYECAVELGYIDALQLSDEARTRFTAVSPSPTLMNVVAQYSALHVHTAPPSSAPRALHAKITRNELKGLIKILFNNIKKDITHKIAVNIITQVLEKAGADKQALLTARDEQGNTALQIATILGKDALTTLLHDLGAAPIGVNDIDLHDGHTLLTRAIAHNNDDYARSLLTLHANPNTPNRDGDTPLLFAVRAENELMVSNLIKFKVDVNQRNRITGAIPLFSIKSTSTPLGDKSIKIYPHSEQEWMQRGRNDALAINDPVEFQRTNKAGRIADHLINAGATSNALVDNDEYHLDNAARLGNTWYTARIIITPEWLHATYKPHQLNEKTTPKPISNSALQKAYELAQQHNHSHTLAYLQACVEERAAKQAAQSALVKPQPSSLSAEPPALSSPAKTPAKRPKANKISKGVRDRKKAEQATENQQKLAEEQRIRNEEAKKAWQEREAQRKQKAAAEKACKKEKENAQIEQTKQHKRAMLYELPLSAIVFQQRREIALQAEERAYMRALRADLDNSNQKYAEALTQAAKRMRDIQTRRANDLARLEIRKNSAIIAQLHALTGRVNRLLKIRDAENKRKKTELWKAIPTIVGKHGAIHFMDIGDPVFTPEDADLKAFDRAMKIDTATRAAKLLRPPNNFPNVLDMIIEAAEMGNYKTVEGAYNADPTIFSMPMPDGPAILLRDKLMEIAQTGAAFDYDTAKGGPGFNEPCRAPYERLRNLCKKDQELCAQRQKADQDLIAQHGTLEKAFEHSCANKQYDTVQRLLTQKPEIALITDGAGNTLSHLYHKDQSIMRMLRKAGHDFSNKQNHDGLTPLDLQLASLAPQVSASPATKPTKRTKTQQSDPASEKTWGDQPDRKHHTTKPPATPQKAQKSLQHKQAHTT